MPVWSLYVGLFDWWAGCHEKGQEPDSFRRHIDGGVNPPTLTTSLLCLQSTRFFLRSYWCFVKTSLKSFLNLSQCCFCFMFSPRGTWDLTSPSRDQTRTPCIEGKILTTGPLWKSFQSAVFSWLICLHCRPLSQLSISFFSGETKHLQSRCPATGKISNLILGQFPHGPQTTQNTLSCLATYRHFFFNYVWQKTMKFCKAIILQ